MSSPRRISPAAAAGLAVVAASLAVFAGTLDHGFVRWDDNITIYENDALGDLGWESVRWAFTDVATTMRFIPLTLLSFSLTHTLHGLDPFGYHLANWLLHGASALLLFLLLRELLARAVRGAGTAGPWTEVAAAAGALAWSLHPLRAEVVAWSNSRGHAQATLLAFLALLLYVRAHREDGTAALPWRAVGLSAAAFLAALLSHPIAIGVAPLFVLADVHLGRLGGAAGWWSPAARRVLVEKLPYAAVAGAVVAATVFVRTSFPGRWEPAVPLSEWGLFPRAMQATYAWVRYALVTLWPVGLQPAPVDLYDFDPWTAPFLARAVLVAGVTAALLLLRRRWPAALLLWLAWLSLLVPALGLTEHPMFACDRYTSLAGLVPAAVVGVAVLRLGATTARRLAAVAGMAALLAGLGALAHAQAETWHDSVSLFEHMLPLLGDHPFRGNVFATLGAARIDRNEPAAAIPPLEQAVTLRPNDAQARNLIGYALFATGRTEEAERHLRAGAAMAPRLADLRCRLAALLVETGRTEAAVEELRSAFRATPGAPCVTSLLSELGASP